MGLILRFFFFFIEVFSKHSTWGMLMNISVFLNIIEVPCFTHPWNLTDYLGFYFLRLVCFWLLFLRALSKLSSLEPFCIYWNWDHYFAVGTHCSYRVIMCFLFKEMIEQKPLDKIYRAHLKNSIIKKIKNC